MLMGFLAQQQKRYGGFGAAAVLAALSLLFTGCGGGSSSGDGSAGTGSVSGRGTLVVTMADAPPAPAVTAVHVTIDRVEAHMNGEWTPIPMTPVTLNLLDLTRVETVLGSASLPAGRYNQVRFFPSQTTVTDAEGTHEVTIPSAEQTGIKVNVDYEIRPDEITTVLLDFNVHKSLHRQGNGKYHMQPVVPAVVKVLSGTITGMVTSGVAPGGPLPAAVVAAVYEAGESYPVGTEVNTGVAVADGTFKIWALLPGTYTLNVTYTDPATGAARTMTLPGVVVAANQNTEVGALVVP